MVLLDKRIDVPHTAMRNAYSYLIIVRPAQYMVDNDVVSTFLSTDDETTLIANY